MIDNKMRRFLSAAAALSSGDPGTTHAIKLGEGERPFEMGDGIDNWAMFGALSNQLKSANS